MDKNKKLKIICSVLGIFMFIILTIVFCIPFFTTEAGSSPSPNEHYSKIQKLYNDIPEENKTVITNEDTGIEISGQKDILSFYSINVDIATPDDTRQTEWNETPRDIINDNSTVIVYDINLCNNDDIVSKEMPYKIEIPVPESLDAEKIKVFKINDNIATPLTVNIKNSVIIIYEENLGKFAVVNDTENSNNKSFLSIKGLSLKYENILSIRIYSSILVPEEAIETVVLMWNTEQDKYTYENATRKGKYLGDNIFELSNIEFKDIDDTIYIKLCVKTKNGYIYSPLVEYNILQYCINLYNSTSDQNLKKLMLGTVAYSQMSNNYIDEDATIFNDFSLATNFKTDFKELIYSGKFSGQNLYSEEGDILFYGRNVDMDNQIHYNIYLKSEVPQPEALYLSATINGKEYRCRFKEDTVYGYYKATFTEIQPYDINTPIYLKVTDSKGKQIGGVLTDSVGTFINEGRSEYVLEKDKDMFAATIYFMSVCEDVFKKN
jgi:hypothetical protein